MSFVVIFFIVWRIVDFFIAFIAHIFDRYKEHFAYSFQLYHYNPYIPQFLIHFANYDGANYLHIAHDGYGMYQQAYFPLFPLLIYLFSPLFNSGFFLTGLIISNLSFFCGLYFFKRYLELIGKKQKQIVWILLFLFVFPMSFFLGAVYTEGLFFLFVTGVLYCSQKKRYVTLVLFSIFAALTRFMGVFLIIPLFATILIEQNHFLLNHKKLKENLAYIYRFSFSHAKSILLTLSPLFGLSFYMIYLTYTAHDPFLFYHAVSGFHTGRTTSHIISLPQVYFRYIKIFIKAPHTFVYFIALLEFFIFNLFLGVLLYDLWHLWKNKTIVARKSLIGLNLFSLVNLLLPTLTGTLTSLPRYAIFSLSFYICLAKIENIWIKTIVLITFFILHILLLYLFIQGYFVS